jgi:hypothetical protein
MTSFCCIHWPLMTYASSLDGARHPNRRPFRLKISGTSGLPWAVVARCGHLHALEVGSPDAGQSTRTRNSSSLLADSRVVRDEPARGPEAGMAGSARRLPAVRLPCDAQKNRARPRVPCPGKPTSCRGQRESEIARCRDACVSRRFACAVASWHVLHPCAPAAPRSRCARPSPGPA